MLRPSTTAEQVQRPPCARAVLLAQLLGFFHLERIPYCVLGDTRRFPIHLDSDIDLMVDGGILPALPAKLMQFCGRRGARLVQVIRHETTAYFFVITWRSKEGERHFLQLDVCGDYYRFGRRFLTAGELLHGRTLQYAAEAQPGFYTAAPRYAFIYYLLKKIDKLELNERQGAYLNQVWHQDPAGASGQIRRFWKGAAAEILTHAAAVNRWEEARSTLPTLREELHSSLGYGLPERRRELIRRVRRILQPTGLFVVFLGPDGSGKTSVIERVLARLSPCFWNTASMHLRPRLGLRPGAAASGPVVDPHGQAQRSPLGSVLKLFYYLFDYNAGYLLEVKPRLIRSTLVAFDRYYHDLIADPKRYRYGGPSRLPRILARLLPFPDLFIFLDAPPEVMQARKQEVSFEETARQRKVYLELAARLPGSRVVDASMPVEAVASEVEDLLLDAMAARTASRIGGEAAA